MHNARLTEFLATLRYEDVPQAAVERTKELFLDWVGSTLAGANARPVKALDDFAHTMGPATGASEVLPTGELSSPFFAALVNAAASHVVEQDDLHRASVFHPATVVFPAALALAQHIGASGPQFITACITGYETGARVGEYLGPSHYRVFHTTGTAGTLAAAVACAHLLGANTRQLLNALGSAGTTTAGLWEFLRDGADSKQLHTAHAAAQGLACGYTAVRGLTGATNILEGPCGMGRAFSHDPNVAALDDGLGEKWAVIDTSIKVHACCRHTHPAADALLGLLREQAIGATEIKSIRARVYQAAEDVLGAVQVPPASVHQSKFSMPFVLALIACKGSASIDDFNESALEDPELLAMCQRVEMVVDAEIERDYPQRWRAAIDLEIKDGRQFSKHIDHPRGDPQNPVSRSELVSKLQRLARYARRLEPEQVQGFADYVWSLEQVARMEPLFVAGHDQPHRVPPAGATG